MTSGLEQALFEQKQQTQQEVEQIPGMLGIPLGGQRVVEVAGRNSYLYVRLRNNQSEVIQAYNNQVAPAYNLPVLVEREGNRYVVIGVDTQRYENNWNSFAPFLPRHGNTHSFDIESGGGGDIVWVYPRQFMPAMVMPSGSLGAGDVFVNAYTLKKNDNTWMYVGNTGTADLLMYRPTSSTGAIMALVYLDVASGNPYLFINSGTVFSNTITGSSQIAPYIPSLTDPTTQIPLAAVRLITGTNAISWDNIYDVRQWIHPSPTGTGGGGSLTVQDEGVSQGTATTLNFVGDNVQATVAGSVARIFVTGSSGGGGINTGTLDARYLKLDASNDPVTGELEINVVRNVITADNYALEVIGENTASPLNALYLESKNHSALDSVVHGNKHFASVNKELPTGTTDTTAVIDLYRYSRGTGTILNAPAFQVTDYQGGMESQSGLLKHIYSFTGSVPSRTLFENNPYAIPTGIVTMMDTLDAITDQSRLLLLRNQGQDKFYVNGSGTAHSNGSPLIKEAPVDGSSYVRKNAGWESATASASVGSWRSIGLIGANNSGTPNTQVDFYANLVTLRNPSTGDLVSTSISTGTLTNNIATAGANGRDQVGAFASGTWIHFYYIWNGTTLATLSSLAYPPANLNFPSGYTHYSYLGAIRYDTSNQLSSVKIKGNKVSYVSAPQVVSANTAINTEESVDVSAYIPPNAEAMYITGYMYAKNDTVNVLIIAQLRIVTGSDYANLRAIIPVANTFVSVPLAVEVPNLGQGFIYRWSANAGISSNQTQELWLSYYVVPNG